MKENPEKITKGAEHLGESCIMCQHTIAIEDEVVVCPRCRSVHHVECWKDKGGCGRTGCPQVAQAILGERRAGDGPPPPVSKKVVFGVVFAVLATILLVIFWPKPPDPAMGRTKVVFMGEAYYELSASMAELQADYNARSEEIYIDLQMLPAGGLDTKLVVLIAANEAPDVITVDEERFAYFLEQGVLLPLGEDESGVVMYGMQHPAQLRQVVVWGATENPDAALEVLHYFINNIPPVDLDLLKELERQREPLWIGG
ncbi:MAG: extracellular solute-binding protein [Limnochordia bacterium]|nr:extracellular solute-binding protein [Limnochordia bacterium]